MEFPLVGSGGALDYYRVDSRILIILLIFSWFSTPFKKDQPEVQINLPEFEKREETRPSWRTSRQR